MRTEEILRNTMLKTWAVATCRCWLYCWRFRELQEKLTIR